MVPLALVGVVVALALVAWPRRDAPRRAQPAPAAKPESVAAIPAPAATPPAPPATLDTFRAETTVAPARRPPPPAAERSRPSAQDAALLGRLRSTRGGRARPGRRCRRGRVDPGSGRLQPRAGRAAGPPRGAPRRPPSSSRRRARSGRTPRRGARVSAPPVSPPETAQRPVAPPPPPAPTPAPAPQPAPAEQIHRLFDEYGSAIESRSVDAIRRVYPGLSPAQSQEWEEFFRGVGDVDVELKVTARGERGLGARRSSRGSTCSRIRGPGGSGGRTSPSRRSSGAREGAGGSPRCA